MTHKMRVSTPLINNDTVRKKYYFTFFQFNKLQLFTSIYFCFAGQTQQPLWGSSSYFGNANQDHPDQEMDVLGLNVPSSWHIGQELYTEFHFDSKKDFYNVIVAYSINLH